MSRERFEADERAAQMQAYDDAPDNSSDHERFCEGWEAAKKYLAVSEEHSNDLTKHNSRLDNFKAWFVGKFPNERLLGIHASWAQAGWQAHAESAPKDEHRELDPKVCAGTARHYVNVPRDMVCHKCGSKEPWKDDINAITIPRKAT